MIQILCVGDSLTAGYPEYDPMWGGNHESQYCYWLEKELLNKFDLKFNIVNKGICGETTRQLARRFEIELKMDSYDIVLAFGGGNDAAIGYSPLDIKDNLWSIIKQTQSGQTTLIAGTAPPFANFLRPMSNVMLSINQALRELYIETDTSFADLGKALADKDGYLKPEFDIGDGVHLNVLGYKKIALTFLPLVSTTFNEIIRDK